MKKLKIAQLAPLWIPVPPRTYGGIELMLYHLTEQLVLRGHDVTLFASGDSKTSARLVAPIPKSIWLEKTSRSPHALITKMLQIIHQERRSFDLIHNHFNFFMFPLALCEDMPPILTTIHRPIDFAYAESIRAYPDIKYCVISEDARRNALEQGIEAVDMIYNGIDPALYPFDDSPEDYLLYLGRLNQEKGIITALEVAKSAGKKLVVAGNMAGAAEWNYFIQEVQPLLNEENLKFVGQVDFPEKIALLRKAKALLFPIDRREPFGLVMIEAMACGTPVLAFRQGSVPEVVEHGKTGFVVDTKEEMVEMVKKIDTIDRKACRLAVETKFTLKEMIDRYELLYKKMIND